MKLSHMFSVLAILIAGLMICGCSDSDSIVVPDKPIDTAPPAVPTGLVAFASGANVRLTWDANTTDADFAGFRVYRGTGEQAGSLTPDLLADPRFVDLSPLPGYATYGVAAVDLLGNESARMQYVYNYPDEDVEIGMQ